MANECESVLAPNIEFASKSQQVKYALLYLVNQETYSLVRDRVEAAGDVNLMDFFKVGDTKASFDQFRDNRTRYFEQHNISLDMAQAVNVASRNIPDSARELFVRCMGNRVGVTALFHDDQDDSASLKITFRGIPGDVRLVEVDLLGGHFQHGKDRWQHTFTHEEEKELLVLRNTERATIKAVINAKGPSTFAKSVPPKELEVSHEEKCDGPIWSVPFLRGQVRR